DHYNPRHLDRDRLDGLVRDYGSPAFVAALDRLGPTLPFLSDPNEDDAGLDEFEASGIRSPDDVVDVFTRQFHFGCEADDPTNAFAFGRSALPFGARLPAMFASDIGHWDVPDVRQVVPEAWELVEDGHLDESDFRAFVCDNVRSLFCSTNPSFFNGTTVET